MRNPTRKGCDYATAAAKIIQNQCGKNYMALKTIFMKETWGQQNTKGEIYEEVYKETK